jgi:hypothetical protein
MIMVNYYAETPNAAIIRFYHTKNIVLKNVTSNSDVGIIIISFGNALDQTYLSVINTLVRFVKGNSFIAIGGVLLDANI